VITSFAPRSLRIGFDAEIFGLQKNGGISVHFYNIICLLADQHIVFLLADSRMKESLLESYFFVELLSKPNITVSYFGQFSEFRDLVSRFHLDIVQSTYLHPRAVISGTRSVYTFHDSAPERFVFKYFRISYVLLIPLRQFVFAFASGISVVSQFSLYELSKFFLLRVQKPNLIVLTGNSVQSRGFQSASLKASGVSSGGPPIRLLFIGLRVGYKNFKSLLDALSCLQIIRPACSISLSIVGGGPLSAAEYRAICSLSIEYSHYLNPSVDELKAIYRQSDILVHTSLYEGFGIPVLEAMRIGLPVVAVDIPSVREVARDTIIYAAGPDPLDIASALNFFIGLPSVAIDEMRAKAFDRSLYHDWHRIARNYCELYHNVAP